MGKPVAAAPAADAVSLASSRDREPLAASCRELAGALYPGLDLGREIAVVLERGIGDVVALVEGSHVAGFAVCHCGPGSEGGSKQVSVKFATVRGGAGADERLRRLVAACENFAVSRGVAKLVACVSTGRIGAYRTLVELGFRIEIPGVAMHRPHAPAYDGPDDWALDDWR